jgi:hypothetical protein
LNLAGEVAAFFKFMGEVRLFGRRVDVVMFHVEQKRPNDFYLVITSLIISKPPSSLKHVEETHRTYHIA